MFTTKPVRNGTHSRPDKRQYHDDFPEVIEPFAEADTRPTKQPRGGYMVELEAWLDESVFEPIRAAIAQQDSKELHLAFNEATVHIKRRVLASYHNGLKARPDARQSN